MAKESDKRFEGRRNFLKGGMGVPSLAATAAGNTSVSADVSKQAEYLNKVKRVLTTTCFNNRYGMGLDSLISPDHRPRIWLHRPTDIADWEKNRKEKAAELEKAIHEIGQLQAEAQMILGNEGIPYQKGAAGRQDAWDRDPLHYGIETLDGIINGEGILKPDALVKLLEKQRDAVIPILQSFRKNLPAAKVAIQTRDKMAEALIKTIKEAYPDGDLQKIEETMGAFVPQGKDWSEHFQNSANVKAALKPILQKRDSGDRWYTRRIYRDKNAPEAIAEQLSQFFNQQLESDQENIYIDVASYSTRLYKALRYIATRNDREEYFPPPQELFKAKLENGELAPIDIQVPPAGYIVCLPRYMARKLRDVITGEVESRKDPDAPEEIITAEKAVAHYRKQAKISMAIANLLEELPGLVDGKWSSRIQGDSEDKLQR